MIWTSRRFDPDSEVLFFGGRAWRHVARLLANRGHQSTLVTLPGSDGNRPCTWRGAVREQAARLVADLVREGPTKPVSLIGDAFGGQVVLEAAAHLSSDRVHSIVLYDVVPHPPSVQNPMLKTYATMPATAFAAQARVSPPGWWTMWSTIDVKTGRNFVDDAAQSEIIESLRRSDAVTVAYELVRGLGSHGDMRQRIESIERPVLALWPSGPAGKERRSREAVAAQYAELRDVVWRTIDGHGAGAMLEAPTAVAGHIRSFWQDTDFLPD